MDRMLAGRAARRAQLASEDAASCAGSGDVDRALDLVEEARGHLQTAEQHLKAAAQEATA